ncbi:MAG: GTP-binding protein, partial [Methanosarcinaceae archaeon]|nr:GTP-binding protein [Methanosarcinaceae archaeon]
MRIIIIGGFLGSGKTTTILKLGRHLSEAGKKVAIIVNEIGEIGLDGDAISDTGIVTEELTSGCICCTLRISMQYTLQNMREEFDPDIIIIEPTGIAFPRQIKEEIAIMNLPELSFAPVVTLVDPGRFVTEINEIPRFIETQIKEAEIVCINKVDITDEVKVLAAEKNLKVVNPDAKILKFSARVGDEQFEGLIDHLASEGREVFGTGDKNSIEMSEVNAHSLELALSEEKLDPNNMMGLAEGILKAIRDRVREINPKFIRHVKLSLKFPKTLVKASVTSADEFPLVELIRD